MVEWFFPWSNSLKTRACRQLIQHYLGIFLQEKLSLDQLSIDLFSGRVQVKDVILNLSVLNESLTHNNIPFEIVKAYVGEINLLIPWNSLIKDNSLLDIKELQITIRPNETKKPIITSETSFELSSMFNSMNTSMLIAQECLKNEIEENQSYQGLETFAATIDSILARVRVTLTDTVIRMEHLINDDDHGVALEIRIKKFEYYDSEASIDLHLPTDSKPFLRPTIFTNKNFVLSGVSLYTDEFLTYAKKSSMTESIIEFSTSDHLIADSMTTSVVSNASSSATRMVGYITYEQILCLTISGTQDIRLKLKQSDQVFGPKVEIEAHCGSVTCLLTPKQLQSLIVLVTAYQKAALNSTSKDDRQLKSKLKSRPMNDDDFKKIEQTLAEEIRKKNFPSEQTDFYTFNDTEFRETPDSMFCSAKGMSASIDLQSSYTSSRNDNASVSNRQRLSDNTLVNTSIPDTTRLKELSRHLLEQSPSCAITKCRLQFNFISVCLLHRDLQPSLNDCKISMTTISSPLKDFADAYFENTSTITTSGLLTTDKQISELREKYSNACLKDHLSIIGKPFTLDFSQQVAQKCLRFDLDIRLGFFDVCECLRKENTTSTHQQKNTSVTDMIYNRLVTFNRSDNDSTSHSFTSSLNSITSSIQINISNFNVLNSNQTATRSYDRQLSSVCPYTDINIRLAQCQIDFDISIIDRIHCLLKACQINQTHRHQMAQAAATHFHNHNSQTLYQTSYESNDNSLIMLNISSPFCTFNLRFPIPDLQPLIKRRPWWIQTIHKELLCFDLKQLHFKSNILLNEKTENNKFEITSECIQVYFMTDIESNERMHIAQVECGNGEIIKLVISSSDQTNNLLNQLDHISETLCESVICRLPTTDNKVPLSNKNALYDNRQMLTAAEADDMDRFFSICSEETKLYVHILIPYLMLYIPNQKFLENIYNKFVNNLFMWECSAPWSNTNNDHMYSTTTGMNDYRNPRLYNSFYYQNDNNNPRSDGKFQTCKTGINADLSDSDTNVSDADDNIEDDEERKANGAHNLVLKLDIKDLHIAAFAPSAPLNELNETEKKTTTTTHVGEFRIDGKDLTLAIVDGYHSDPNLQYFCLMTKSASLHHNGHAIPLKNNARLSDVIGRTLPELIRSLPPNTFPKYNHNDSTMIRAAFEIRTNADRSNGKQKTIRGSFSIDGAMLHQKFVPKAENWLLQLIELFDLTDDEVPGYIPSTSVVEWYLEFRHCAISYRPLHFDVKCFVAIESLTLASTYVKNSKTTLLELDLDEWAIYLSKKREKYQIDVQNDYVCVMNGGAFEVKLCFNDLVEEILKSPLVDIKISCNMINLRTCSDSAAALIDLLKYIVTDGDLQTHNNSTTENIPTDTVRKHERPPRLSIGQIFDGGDDIDDNTSTSILKETKKPSQESLQTMMLEEAMKEQKPDQMHTQISSSSISSCTLIDHQVHPSPSRTIARSSPTIKMNQSDILPPILFDTHQSDSDNEIKNDDIEFESGPVFSPSLQTETSIHYRNTSVSVPSFSLLSKVSEKSNNRIRQQQSSNCLYVGSERRNDDFREFELIEREIGMGRPPQNGVCQIHVLTDQTIHINDNHFSKPLERNDILNAPSYLPVPTFRFSIRNLSLVWFIYGGSDFKEKSKSDDGHQPLVQLNIDESIRSFAVTSNDTIGGNTTVQSQKKAGGRLLSAYDPSQLNRRQRGGTYRDLNTSMEFSITKARCQYEIYPDKAKQCSRFAFAIHEFEIRDRLIARSEINKFLYLYTTEALPRRTHADMLVIKVLYTKPEGFDQHSQIDGKKLDNDVSDINELLECEIKVSLQPLRINIDQDALVFMRQFFTELTVNNSSSVTNETSSNLPGYQNSSMDADHDDNTFSSSPRSPTSVLATPVSSSPPSSTSAGPSVFIKHFVFSPSVPIRLDYHGKLRNELLFEQGPFLNLLIGLAQLNKVDLNLKRIFYKRGLLGYERLLTFILNEWLHDIRPTDVLKGIVPISSITQIVQGIRDLFWLPIDQYRKDGRIIRGIQRGASSFTTSTALAIIELSNRLVHCAHIAALLCFELVSPSTLSTASSLSLQQNSSSNNRIMVRSHPPPNDIREGVSYAVNVVRQSINATSHTLKTEAQIGKRRKGVLGVVGGILRQMPAVAVQPLVTSTKAAENFLVGVRNQLDRDERNDDKEKYKSQ
ncbi:unnamed protein product [Didymodactylos carnosus]|uniref:Autophagy-related protein 2 n=1 Tax=Didymodactylos carnosus TaxID=1234261 RepID=A0A8S2HM53_9BILA|nr:unnamed protein product [Didymodactylos carnosus]CAF3665828.1 unnamed protein product [Didymodactylos carnosus]